MRSLSFLTQEHPPVEDPGLSTSDERLASISALADAGKYTEAADEVEGLVEQGIFDIRLLVFVAFDVFMQDGLPHLDRAVLGLTALLTSSREAVGPKVRRDDQIGRSLRWLLEKICDTLEYHEKKQDDLWQGWRDGITAEGCVALREHLEALIIVAGQPALEATTEACAHLNRWLRDTEAYMASTPKEEPGAEPEATEPARSLAPSSASLDLRSPQRSFEVKGSAKLIELLNKLQAFERLVEGSSFEKAAMVGDDVMRQLDAFDPREYFPDLFSQFGALLSSHVEDITPHWQHRDSVRWKMLEQFYKVDLERFVEDR